MLQVKSYKQLYIQVFPFSQQPQQEFQHNGMIGNIFLTFPWLNVSCSAHHICIPLTSSVSLVICILDGRKVKVSSMALSWKCKANENTPTTCQGCWLLVSVISMLVLVQPHWHWPGGKCLAMPSPSECHQLEYQTNPGMWKQSHCVNRQ